MMKKLSHHKNIFAPILLVLLMLFNAIACMPADDYSEVTETNTVSNTEMPDYPDCDKGGNHAKK